MELDEELKTALDNMAAHFLGTQGTEPNRIYFQGKLYECRFENGKVEVIREIPVEWVEED